MSKVQTLLDALQQGEYSDSFASLYPKEQAEKQPQRVAQLATIFLEQYGEPEEELRVFSAPGRTEVGGNHTDHQQGNTLSAAVNKDAIAVAAKNGENVVRIQSQGYPEDIIDLDQLEKNVEEENQAIALLRGILFRIETLGYEIGGFNAYTTSDVPSGSGLSSSAAFENLISTIINYLFNDGKIDPVTIAQIGQYAENEYFGKPSGLMDQATSAVGGLITIDFQDVKNPVVKEIPFDFSASQHALCIVETGGDHADLTDDYASVSNDMFDVAAFFEKDVLRQVPEEEFYNQLAEIRRKINDRAVLRAMHFYGDDKRVLQQVKALEQGDFDAFKSMVVASGLSSCTQLQNIYSCSQPTQQGLSLALALSQKILEPKGGAWRVHGGGFGGTILAFVPLSFLEEYQQAMDNVFGQGACQELVVRPVGVTEITKNK